jgi:prepilin-type N-terminal cleavage/methylation domain-containing protein
MSRINVHRSIAPGFTLIELMISMSLLAIVFAAVFSAYLFLGRNLTRLVNVQQQQVQSRRTLRTFTQDLSSASQLTTATSTQIALSKPAGNGTATVTFRYANAPAANRPMSIMVNGTVVNSNLAFNSTGAWTTWATTSIVVSLNPGSNTIRATATTANGGPNVDKIDVTSDTTSSPVTYQGENAFFYNTTFENINGGYTGTGYANYANAIGSYAQWTVNQATSAVTYTYAAPSPATAANGTLTRTETIPPAAATTQILLSGLTAFTFNYYDGGGTAITSSPQNVKSVELSYTAALGTVASGTQAGYVTVSPRVVLRNKPILQ